MFDWAPYRLTKGAVKLHLVLDHGGYLLQLAVITDGKTSDLEVARRREFEPGTMLVFDRVIRTLTGGWSCHGAEVLFVTRPKDNANYGVLEERPVPQGPEILRDEVIVLAKRKKRGRTRG